jgi:hypothetical protein
MPQLILTPPTFVEGQTIEIRQEDGRKVSVFWRDEDTLVIDGDERPILMTEWDADSIAFAFIGADENKADYAWLDDEDSDEIASALSNEFAKLRERDAAHRAERIERLVAEVAQSAEEEKGQSLTEAELAYIRKLVRDQVIGRTSA